MVSYFGDLYSCLQVIIYIETSLHDVFVYKAGAFTYFVLQSWSGDLNPGPLGTKQPLYHLSYHPLTANAIISMLVCFVKLVFWCSKRSLFMYFGIRTICYPDMWVIFNVSSIRFKSQATTSLLVWYFGLSCQM